MAKRKQLKGRKVKLPFPAPRYRLAVFYDGGLDCELDLELFRAVGRTSDSSGCWVVGPCTRYHDWHFAREASARRAFNAVCELRHGPNPLRRVELWDDALRLLDRRLCGHRRRSEH